MAQDGFPLSVTLKASKDYDAPWIVIYGHNPDEIEQKLDAVVTGNLAQKAAEAAQHFRAQENLAKGGVAPQQPAQASQAPAQPGPGQWGTEPPQQPQTPWSNAPQQPQQQQYGGPQKGQPHPQGTACHCGKVLEFSPTRNGKPKYQCPDWRWNNGNPNNHAQEWAS